MKYGRKITIELDITDCDVSPNELSSETLLVESFEGCFCSEMDWQIR